MYQIIQCRFLLQLRREKVFLWDPCRNIITRSQCMTGFLWRSIFRVCAEILIFGEIYTSGFCSSRSSHSQLFLFSSQLSHSPAAAHIWFSFSASSMHLRFLQRCHGGHLCSSSSSGQRDKVLERAEIKGDTSSSFFSSTFCSCSCNSSLQSPLVGDIIREQSRGESPEGLLIFSGEGRVLTFLCAFPLWIFKPFSVPGRNPSTESKGQDHHLPLHLTSSSQARVTQVKSWTCSNKLESFQSFYLKKW